MRTYISAIFALSLLAAAPFSKAEVLPTDTPGRVELQPAAEKQPDFTLSAVNTSRAAAIADGISTHIALAHGAVEKNPIVNPSPVGLLVLTAGKVALATYADTLPKEQRALALKASAAVWGGAAANNLALLATSGFAPIVIGVGVGYWLWTREAEKLREEAISPASAVAIIR